MPQRKRTYVILAAFVATVAWVMIQTAPDASFTTKQQARAEPTPKDAKAASAKDRQSVRLKHSAWPSAVAFSPDGLLLASATEHLHLWDLATGKELSRVPRLPEGGERCMCLVFSPNGKYLASVELNYSRLDQQGIFIRLWQVTITNQLRHLKTLRSVKDHFHPSNDLYHVAFSPDSRTLVAGSREGLIYLWETATGKERLRFQANAVAAAFSGDGRALISVSHDGRIDRWDAMTGKELDPRKPGKRKEFIHVSRVVFAPDGNRLAVSDYISICLKDVSAKAPARRLDDEELGYLFALSPDGSTLATREGTTLCFRDAITGGVRRRLKNPDGNSIPEAISWDGQYVASAAREDDDVTLTVQRLDTFLPVRGAVPEPAPVEPPGTPLRAELVAVKDTYVLDLGCRPAELFSNLFQSVPWPIPPAVDVRLKLKNIGDKALTVKTDGLPFLHLTGPGAINVTESVQTIGGRDRPRPVVLAPGESHSLPITDLSCGGDSSYWLTAGEYWLHLSYWTAVSPAPKGAEDQGEGVGAVRLRCAPLRLKVVEPKR